MGAAMIMLLCFFALRDAAKGETFGLFEGILVHIALTLLWMLAVVELVGELYGTAWFLYLVCT